MDKNSANSISKITEGLHEEVTVVYEHLMDEEYREASRVIDNMVGALKHLKTNLKKYEI